MAGLIDKIIHIAEGVYAELGSGHSEAAYQKAMEIGLRLHRRQPLRFQAQKVLELTYKDHYVGECYIDLLVEDGSDSVVVELKATPGKLGAPELQQLTNYMRLLGVKSGLLINFVQPGRSAKVVASLKPEVHPVSL
jgi:GxxExxY protein